MGISCHDAEQHPIATSRTPTLYWREDAAYQLSMSVRSLDYMIAGKKIATQRMGARILISHAELVRLATTAQIKSVV
jgi:hypothetical protein